MNVILASQSPRRRELLGLFRIPFTVRAADIDETMDPALPAEQEVARVSRAKAMATPAKEEDVVIAADTIVVCNGKTLGKPKSKEQAVEMLTMLSGRDHQVMTGLTVRKGEDCRTVTEITHLHFRKLSQREILDYVSTGEPMDKAGAYGIQGRGCVLVEGIDGNYHNVVGLPTCLLAGMLRQVGIDVLTGGQEGRP